MTSLNQLKSRIQDLRGVPERLRVMMQVAKTSGLLWEVSVPGVLAMTKAMAAGAQSPSQVYRIHAANTPHKAAIHWRDRTLTFGELDARMDRLAGGLRRRGMKRGQSVVVMMRNRPEFIELGGAVGRLGSSAVAVSWRSTAAELVYLATHCGATALAFEHDFWPIVEEAMKELPAITKADFICIGGDVPGTTSYESLLEVHASFVPETGAEEDAAVVIYTSGTTGKPKGAVRKFPKDAFPAALRFIKETPMRTDDVHLVTCPLYHSTAFGFMTLSHILGAEIVIMDEFKPEGFLDLIERHGITTTAVVPTMLHRILSLGEVALAKRNLRSLRVIFTGGAPLPGPLAVRAMDQFGDILFNFYGATETGLVTLGKPEDLRAAPTTIGKAVPGNEIRLLSDSGEEVKNGEVGELFVKNNMLVAGYHKDEQATQGSMKDGFFSVGDLARKDRDGRYFIEGRKRDMVISGGVNVYPAEVEGVLETHPDIAEVAVIGVEDPEWGERVRAFVATRPGAQLDEGALKIWARERLSGPKVPRDFVFVDALPRNPTGKVLKRDLRNSPSTPK